MAEYIERAAAIDAVSEVYYDTPDVNLSAKKFEAAINAIPAADVAPVVRCKDCIHCGFCGDATNLQVMGFYGFCSRGERKDGGDDRV